MVILFGFGQTCNRFFIYSNYLADAIENKTKVYILAPDISLPDYSNLLNSRHIVFPFYFRRIASIFGFKSYINFLMKIFENKYSKKIISFLFSPFNQIEVIDALNIKELHKSKYRSIYRELIAEEFQTNELLGKNVRKIFSNQRKSTTTIIGIHMRKGDYKYFEDGKYFFSNDDYKNVMRSVENMFRDKDISFFLASNEKILLEEFNEFNSFYIPNSNAAMDLLGLSLCSFILGPPSTYSGWASFVGMVPLKFINNPLEKFNISSFKDILEIWSENSQSN